MTAKVVQLRDFNEVVRITGRKLAALEDWVKESEKKRNSFEVSIGENLLELRDRVDAGEIGELANWWEWFEDNRMLLRNIARRTAERYMQIASAPDPEGKVIELRGKNRADKAASTQRQRQGQEAQGGKVPIAPEQAQMEPESSPEPKPQPESEPEPAPVRRVSAAPTYPSSPEDDELIEQFLDLFRRMSWDGRVRAMKGVGALYNKWRVGEDA